MQILQLLLTLLGAIGIFLFGMKMMSEALQKLAGQRMRSFISTLAQNPVRGIFSGLTVTGALQSSSAATVMVVGLSGAGLLTFREAFSLIMGANIGTTLKAWLISYVGFGYDLNNLALPFVAVGIVLLLSRRVSRKHWGEFLIGFALLFIGIEFLKAQTEVLTSQPGLISFVRSLNNQGLLSMVFFALAGVVLTAILQSSSAMMAFTFAMVSSGWIEYPMAAAMVLGENIGTTVTANIAALVSDSRARRSALSHSLFNVFGVFLAILLFNPYINLIAWFTEWAGWTSPFDSASSIPFALAALHTSFKIGRASCRERV